MNLIIEQALKVAKDHGHPPRTNVTTPKKDTNTPPSSITLAERFARLEAKKVAALEAWNKEAQRSRQSEKISTDEIVSPTGKGSNALRDEGTKKKIFSFLNHSEKKSSVSNNDDPLSTRESEKQLDASNSNLSSRIAPNHADLPTTAVETTGENSSRSDYKSENVFGNESTRSPSRTESIR